MRILSVIVFFIAFTTQVWAQEDCKLLIKQVYEKLSKEYESHKEDVFYTKFKTTISAKGENGQVQPPVSQDTEIYVKGNKTYIQSANIVVMQDETYSVQIDNNNRRIVLAKSQYNPDAKQSFMVVQDTILKYLVNEECLDITANNKKITLRAKPQLKAKTGMDKVIFWVSVPNQTMTQMEVLYVPGMRFQKMNISYGEWKWLNKFDVLKKSPKSLIFDAKGVLLPQYKGYTYTNVAE